MNSSLQNKRTIIFVVNVIYDVLRCSIRWLVNWCCVESCHRSLIPTDFPENKTLGQFDRHSGFKWMQQNKSRFKTPRFHTLVSCLHLGPVSRHFSGLFRVPQFPLFLRNNEALSHQTLQPSCFSCITNMLRDQFLKTSGLQVDNWFFGPEKFSGRWRNWPLERSGALRCHYAHVLLSI